MYNIQDNIVALATVPGKSALNVVRCSGPQIVRLYKDLTKSSKNPAPNYAHLKTVYSNKEIVDELMLTFFAGPKSFTGQDMLELSTHGGFVIVKPNGEYFLKVGEYKKPDLLKSFKAF